MFRPALVAFEFPRSKTWLFDSSGVSHRRPHAIYIVDLLAVNSLHWLGGGGALRTSYFWKILRRDYGSLRIANTLNDSRSTQAQRSSDGHWGRRPSKLSGPHMRRFEIRGIVRWSSTRWSVLFLVAAALETVAWLYEVHRAQAKILVLLFLILLPERPRGPARQAFPRHCLPV